MLISWNSCLNTFDHIYYYRLSLLAIDKEYQRRVQIAPASDSVQLHLNAKLNKVHLVTH